MAKRYRCPYCDKMAERKDLVDHIDKSHKDMIPDGYSANRVVFQTVNHKDHGTCRVCGKETKWNESAGRFDVICDNPKCKQHLRDEYKKNMLRVKGTYNILNDPEQQQKMLANRSISGKYKFSDGSEIAYTGSYERKFLEFMDVVMNVNSKDILSPGPIMEYTYNGEKHIYISDFLYIPYNLIIEVKDGGDNPNTKVSPGMVSSREKTLAKEKVITDKGEYNYIRLTNNNFSQLIEVFMELKMKSLECDTSRVIRVNESTKEYNEDKEINTLFEAAEYYQGLLRFDNDNLKPVINKSGINSHIAIIGEVSKEYVDKLNNEFKKINKLNGYGNFTLLNENGNYNICTYDESYFMEAVKNAPKKCDKCGSSNIAVYILGEPIYKCKDCGAYLGTV